MTYLNLDLDYLDHPKTTRLVAILGRGAELIPIRLWAYIARYHYKDGRLSDYSTEAIEQALKWRGLPGQAVEGLLSVGYLDKTKDGYKAHGWAKHQGHIFSLKMRNKKVARNRWKSIKKHNLSNNYNS